MKPVVVHTGAGRMVSSCGRPSAVLLLTAALAGCSGGGANSDAGGGSASLAGGGTASMAGGGGSTSVGGGGGTVETDGGSGGMLQVDVSGLDGMLYLTLDGTEEIAIDADGVSAFSRTLGQGAAYALEVTGHPLAQFCAIDAATGTFDAGAEPISVRCEAGFAAVSIFEEYEEDGSVARRQQTTYDEATGQRTSSRSATGPGDDGVWFNADDEGLAWTLFTYEGEELSERRTIEGLGDDGVAGTDDDDITFLAEYPVEDGEQIGYLEYDGPGDDGDWFTGDETITSSSYRFENVSVDDQGRPTCRVQRRPGVDLAFDTADDEFSDIRGYEYQRIEPQGFDLTLETTFDEDAGGNGIPCEEGDPTRLLSERYVDDQGRLAYSTNFASRYYRNLYDETGARVGDERYETVGERDFLSDESDDTLIQYRFDTEDPRGERIGFDCRGVGGDGTLGTDDDECTASGEYGILDEMGRVVREYDYSANPGIRPHGDDNVLHTDDDRLSSYRVYSYDDYGQRCYATSRDPGPNGTWDAIDCGNGTLVGDTLDDVIDWVQWTERDETGRVLREGLSNGVGLDGVWMTADDSHQLNQARLYTHLPDGSFIERRVMGIGEDGILYTPDDELAPNARRVRLNARGREVLEMRIDGPGDDGEYGTGDDVASGGYSLRVEDRSGNAVEELQVSGPGPDGLWLTDDDSIANHAYYEMRAGENQDR